MLYDTLDLTLDVLEGCRHNCTGCQVNRKAKVALDQGRLADLIKMVADMTEQGIRTYDLTIGPTDFLSATNFHTVVRSRWFRRLAGHFDTIVLNSPFLNPLARYQDYGRFLATEWPSHELKLVVPLEFKHFDKRATYVEKLIRHIEAFSEAFGAERVRRVYFTINYEHGQVGGVDKQVLTPELLGELHAWRPMPNAVVDFALPHTRGNLFDLNNRQRYLNSVSSLNELLVAARDLPMFVDAGEIGPSPNDASMTEGLGYDFLYASSRLYWRPFLLDRVTVIDPCFEIELDWVASKRAIDLAQRKAYSALATQPAVKCFMCDWASHCRARGVPLLQQLLKTTQCLSALGMADTQPVWR